LKTLGTRIGTLDPVKTLKTLLGTPLDLRSVRAPKKTVDPYYNSPPHRAWRDEVIRRAGGRCQDPDHDPSRPRSGIRLEADHIIERKDGGSDLDPDNGLARCRRCHARKTERSRLARHTG
jgi:5-methylcytosine-specific restriction protein A